MLIVSVLQRSLDSQKYLIALFEDVSCTSFLDLLILNIGNVSMLKQSACHRKQKILVVLKLKRIVQIPLSLV